MYTKLLERNIELAFKLLKDLAKDAVFHPISKGGFNFNSAELSTTAGTSVSVKIVPLKVSKPDKERGVISIEVLAKATDLGELSHYSEVTYSGYNWKVGDMLVETGRVWLFKLYRET